jgi:hypothetical protein
MAAPPPPAPSPAAPSADETLQVRLARAHGVDRWPDVFQAIQAGRGFSAEGLLRSRRKSAPSDAERRRIDEVLAVRRIFAEPVRKTPGLGRLNGVGTGMYGASDRDPEDGTYVKTQFFSFLWLPVLPLSQWVVRDGADGGWHFYAKVPLSRTMRVWQIAAIASGATAMFLAVALGTWFGGHPRVHLLNGLPYGAQVAWDDEPAVDLPPGAHESLRMPSGRHRIVCRVGDRVVDDRTVDLGSGTDLAMYAVAGSAPVELLRLPYTKEKSASREPPEATREVLAGETWVAKKGVQHVFEEPPETVSMKSYESVVWRAVARLSPGGWRDALELVEEAKGAAAAADLAERFATAMPGSSELAVEATVRSKASRSPADHEAFLARLADAKAAAPR